MDNTARAACFQAATRQLPLVAILRGLTPEEAGDMGQMLYEAGFRLVEVPLNSPRPFESIEIMRKNLPADCIVGAGTVLRPEDVDTLADLGADIVIMPHADLAVIRRAKARGLICMPAVVTPTEAFAALGAGADALKLFPAEMITPAVVKSLRAVLPPELGLFPVGGINPENMAPYVAAGARGFGLGSALYKKGSTLAQVKHSAQAFISAWQGLSHR